MRQMIRLGWTGSHANASITKALWQIILTCAVLAARPYIWIAYVPAAQSQLDRIGLLSLLGIDAWQTQDAEGIITDLTLNGSGNWPRQAL